MRCNRGRDDKTVVNCILLETRKFSYKLAVSLHKDRHRAFYQRSLFKGDLLDYQRKEGIFNILFFNFLYPHIIQSILPHSKKYAY